MNWSGEQSFTGPENDHVHTTEFRRDYQRDTKGNWLIMSEINTFCCTEQFVLLQHVMNSTFSANSKGRNIWTLSSAAIELQYNPYKRELVLHYWWSVLRGLYTMLLECSTMWSRAGRETEVSKEFKRTPFPLSGLFLGTHSRKVWAKQIRRIHF